MKVPEVFSSGKLYKNTEDATLAAKGWCVDLDDGHLAPSIQRVEMFFHSKERHGEVPCWELR